MKKQNKISAKIAPAKKDEKALMTAPESAVGSSPIFVEAEKMFERFTRLTEEIGHKAFEFFLQRGGEYGKAFEDWLKAESEVLLPIPVEVIENKEQFKVLATVQGFKPEEIEVCLKDNLLILSGKTETEVKKEDENKFYTEWQSNRFFRTLPLSKEVDADKVKADLKDGVLQLTLPKLPERKPKQIAVNEV